MATIDKKQKRWYSKSTFDSLDKTAIPVGTEIQVTGELGQSDFDTDTNSKLNDIANKLDKTGGTISGSLTITQNLIVNGTTSTVDTQNLKVADKLIYVAKDNTVALISPAGLITPKYDGTNNGGIVYDSTGTAFVGDIALDSSGNVDVNNSDLQPIATRDSYSNFTNGHKVKAEVDSSQKSVKFIDGGKDDGINSLTNADLTFADTTVLYDATNGIQLTSTGRFTYTDGTHDATIDLALPVVGKDGITIDKAADSEKIEISGKNLVKSVADTENGYKVYVVSNHKDITVPLAETPMTYGVAQYNRGGKLKTSNPIADLDAANKKYVDDAIANISSTTKYQHNLVLEGIKDGSTFKAFMSIMRNDDATITTLDEVVSILGTASNPCTGYIYDGNQKIYNVIAFNASGPVFEYNDPEAGGAEFAVTNDDVTITDDPIEF